MPIFASLTFQPIKSCDTKIRDLIGHKGEVTSIKFVDEVLYSTDDEKTVIAWTIEDGKGFILS